MQRMRGSNTAKPLRGCSILVAMLSMLAACAGPRGYENAFSQKTALTGNSQTVNATADRAFAAAKTTLAQQGFTIEQADLPAGLLRAQRTMKDPKKAKISYVVTTTVDITSLSSQPGSTVTVSANQQTLLHDESQRFVNLGGLISLPIPTGKDYNTVVRSQGTITDKAFYQDFFTVLTRNLDSNSVSSANAPIPSAPIGAASPPVTGKSSTATSNRK